MYCVFELGQAKRAVLRVDGGRVLQRCRQSAAGVVAALLYLLLALL
jgi:hypothetical protein